VPSADAGVDEEGIPYPYPYPYPPVTWQLGGDDESFTRLAEVDALPGSDSSAFRNLRSYARSHGYVTSSPSVDGGTATDAGWPSGWLDASVHDSGVKKDASAPHSDGGFPWPSVDAGHP
jgi:hypothetical protein